MGEKRIVIEFSRSGLLVALLFLVFAVTSILVVYVDYNTEYTWIYPLDTERVFFTYLKPQVLVSVQSTIETSGVTGIVSGIPGLIRVRGTGDYAIVLARGPSIYVLAVVALSTVLFVLNFQRFRRILSSTSPMRIALLVVLTLLFLMPTLTLLLYVNDGFNCGFSFREDFKSVYFRDLKYGVVNETGIPQIVYNVRDDIAGGFGKVYLVAFRVNLQDPVVPIVVLSINTPSGVYRELALSKSFYLTSGSLNITVFSSSPLVNTTLIYYKAEFTEKPGYSILATLIPTILLILDVVITTFTYRKLRRVIEARRSG
jgi:hypothetical protein